MTVVDASALIEYLLQTKIGRTLEKLLFKAEGALNAPHLLDIEVAQVLRRLLRGRALSEERARQALDDLLGLPIERHAHEIVLPRVWALQNQLSAYDATYVALAEALDCPLLTTDTRLAVVAKRFVRVDVVGPRSGPD